MGRLCGQTTWVWQCFIKWNQEGYGKCGSNEDISLGSCIWPWVQDAGNHKLYSTHLHTIVIQANQPPPWIWLTPLIKLFTVQGKNVSLRSLWIHIIPMRSKAWQLKMNRPEGDNWWSRSTNYDNKINSIDKTSLTSGDISLIDDKTSWDHLRSRKLDAMRSRYQWRTCQSQHKRSYEELPDFRIIIMMIKNICHNVPTRNDSGKVGKHCCNNALNDKTP